MIRLTNFPVSPSVNEIYSVIKNRKISSSKLRSFETAAKMWSYKNRSQVIDARKNLKEWGLYSFEIELNLHFKRIFTLKGEPKRYDASNRIKAAEDNICRLLGFDDKRIMKISIEKKVIVNEIEEHMNFNISKYEFNKINFRGKDGQK